MQDMSDHLNVSIVNWVWNGDETHQIQEVFVILRLSVYRCDKFVFVVFLSVSEK